jgi:endo-1,4-beta-xylanase
VLTIRRRDGSPLACQEVVVAQRSHAFRFGCTGFEAVELAGVALDDADRDVAERILERWLELFNTATLPFYWARFEPIRGRPDTPRLLAAARWFVDRGCDVKGHPLCWHTLAPDWLLDLAVAEVAMALRARITREVADGAGLIDTWDAIN